MPNTTHVIVFNPIGLFFAYLMRNGGLQGAAPAAVLHHEGLAQGPMGFARIKRLLRHRGMLRISVRKFQKEAQF